MSLRQGSWTAQTVELPLNQIDRDEANRKTMTGLEKLEADVIRVRGLYYPIIVSPYAKLPSGEILVGEDAITWWNNTNIPDNLRKYMIFDGERRFVVVQRLSWATIPALIRTKENLIELHELQLASNAKREDMNPLDMAQAIERYIKEKTATGLTVSEVVNKVAELTDFSRTYIGARLDILKMPLSVQQDVQKGIIGANVATEILHNIPADYQHIYITKAENHEMTSTLEPRVVGKQLELINQMALTIPQKQEMGKSLINRAGRFEYNIEANPDLPAYTFEANAFFKRVGCWNIKGATVKECENIAGIIYDTLMLFRNMQKEELGISRIGELKEKQWHEGDKKP